VSLLSRGTKYRRILNEGELLRRLEDSGRFEQVNLANFSHSTPFLTQLELIANTDILVSAGYLLVTWVMILGGPVVPL
jgi:hypothetical protein